MFARNVLLLRALPAPSPWPFSIFGFRRRYPSATTVMEVKRYLLGCVRKLKIERLPMPSMVVVDAGANNADIKCELDRWLESHPRLRRVQVVLRPRLSWIRRWWK